MGLVKDSIGLLGLLGTLGEKRRNWHNWPELIQVYNNTVHSSTGYSPHYLMFGRHGILPQDRLLGLPETVGCSSVEDWVRCHQRQLQYVSEKARQHRDSEMSRQKAYYDQRADHSPLMPGQQVLLQDMEARGRGKLANWWEQHPYRVVQQVDPELPVYIIRQGEGNNEKVVHHNLLRPLPSLVRRIADPSQASEARCQEGVLPLDPQPHTRSRVNLGPPWEGFGSLQVLTPE